MDETVYMLSRIVDAAVWCLAAMLGIALGAATVAYCGERLRRFARLGLVLCGLAACVTLFSVKPPAGDTNGVNRVQAPLRIPCPPSPVEPAADIVRIGEIAVSTNEFAYGHFDRNNNNLPDWWEAVTELSADGRNVKEYEDTDGDGLINLHEFWAGTNPLVPDGSNTLLSVISRSVDTRLGGMTSTPSDCKQKFINYTDSGTSLAFVVNQRFWAADIDSTCVSMWNDSRCDIWGGGAECWQQAGTAISRKHLICAWHFAMPPGTHVYFLDSNGELVTRTISGNRGLGTDICISSLDAELPPSVKPAKFLPFNCRDYLLHGKYLPMVMLDQEEKLLVSDCGGLVTYAKRSILTSALEPISVNRKSMCEATIPGDSGSPRFFI